MTQSYELLLPPLKLSDRTIYEKGAIVENLPQQDILTLLQLGVIGQVTARSRVPVGHLQSVPLNLNTATEEQLQTLPNIGRATAQKIIKARPFASVSDAKAASGLKDSQWEEASTRLIVE